MTNFNKLFRRRLKHSLVIVLSLVFANVISAQTKGDTLSQSSKINILKITEENEEGLESKPIMTEYIDNILWIYQENNGVLVGLSCDPVDTEYGKYYNLGIFVQNNTDHPMNFDPETVTATFLNKKGKIKEPEVYTYKQFEKKIKHKNANKKVLAGLLGLFVFADYCDPDYGYWHSHDCIDAVVDGIEVATCFYTLGDIMKNKAKLHNQGYMKKNTVHVGESMIGFMFIQRYKKGKNLYVHLSVDGRNYAFNFQL